ncbi:hypothetical protein [cf. Phormidesmis sp. LEGE 11477]|uniref:hypothetical protein n=1 Tax=cf. Phormidesmis sp. LEGE 11477 TaxID=1828680 RepID=UPI00187FD1CD|nr:hypothetical protein [cf. Phormidesmis sp. LEGE 11477]MBE9064261.1 hypothetical protein [cf. Phormidesmis sp. LEGE 11477]
MVKIAFHIEYETAPGEVIAPGSFTELRNALLAPPAQAPQWLPAAPAAPAATPAGRSIAALPPATFPGQAKRTTPVQPSSSMVPGTSQTMQNQSAVKDRKPMRSAILFGGCVGCLFLFLLYKHGHRVIPLMAETTQPVESTEPTTTAPTTAADSEAVEAPNGETVVLETPNPAAGTHPPFPNTTPDAALKGE